MALAGVVLALLVGLAGEASRRWLEASSETVHSIDETRRRDVERRAGIHPKEYFDLAALTVPVDQLYCPGVLRDDIPSLTRPEYVPGTEADFLTDEEPVIGIDFNGDARAYPLKVMDAHEAVNDTVGGIPVAVTYCPLCDSSIVFDRRVGNEAIEFGISGLLYNSNVLLYDRRQDRRESLWSQVAGAALSGPAVGQTLQMLPVEVTTWGDWIARHPDTQLLAATANYVARGYQSYFSNSRLYFPVDHIDDRLPLKTPVLGIQVSSLKRAYPLTAFESRSDIHALDEQLGQHRFRLVYEPEAKSLRVVEADEGVESLYAFWFAWYAFHPDTEVFDVGNAVEP